MEDDKTDHIDGIFMTLAHRLKASKPLLTTLSNTHNNSSSTPSEIRAADGLRLGGAASPSIILGKEHSHAKGDKGECGC